MNLYPHDIERAAENVDGVRKGCVIALRVDAEREGFAVLAEVLNARRGGRAPAYQPRHHSTGKPSSWARPARGTVVPRRNLAEDTVGQAAQELRSRTALPKNTRLTRRMSACGSAIKAERAAPDLLPMSMATQQ